MATKPGTNPKGEFVFFDVVYEDGSQRSNRRVPAELLGGLEKDDPAPGFLIVQDGGGPDVFVHISAVEQAGMSNLNEGQKLSFDVQADQRSGKSAAANLQAV